MYGAPAPALPSPGVESQSASDGRLIMLPIVQIVYFAHSKVSIFNDPFQPWYLDDGESIADHLGGHCAGRAEQKTEPATAHNAG
jgi:hypothetical protein